MLRLAITNIHRPGALTPSVVLSLGLGLAVLVTITQIDGNLRRQFLAALPEHAPSFYFIDIPSSEADRFAAFLQKTEPQSTVEDVPMLRGRIVAARGVRRRRAEPLDRRRMGAAERPRPDLYRRSPEGIEGRRGRMVGSRTTAARRWSRSRRRSPTDCSLKLGDEIVVNVLGRDIPAKIGNMRNIDWQGLGINFVLVFSPNAFKGAPHTHIATLTEPHPSAAEDARIIKAGGGQLSRR